jgi:DNA mismatch repair protein MutS2
MKMTVSELDVEVIEDPEPVKKKSVTVIHDHGGEDSSGPSLDLRGKRYEEAMEELELYLDRSFRAGRMEVTIIHGIGTGALREGTRKLLEGLPYVKEFKDSGMGLVGAGSTIVVFDP